MTETREARIERAAQHVGARKLTGDRYAYRDDSTQLWYVLGADELAELCDYLDHRDPDIRRDAYSHWCAGSGAQEMPRGWTPADRIILGWIAAPTGAGSAYAQHVGRGRVWGFRGRRPRWYDSLAAAHRGCRAIEREGWRDGGRGRDCYVVEVSLLADGEIGVRAGGDGGTGLHLGDTAALTVGCSGHVADAVEWLRGSGARSLRTRVSYRGAGVDQGATSEEAQR